MFNETKRKIAKKCLDGMLESKDPAIFKDLAIAATAIARRMMMDWLDAKGIHHCLQCPSDQQLVSLGGDYYCPSHAKNHASKPLELIS